MIAGGVAVLIVVRLSSLACCWVGAVLLPKTRLHLPCRAQAYGCSRLAAFSTRLVRSFMSGGACAFTTRSGMVLCCSQRVVIIRRSLLVWQGHKGLIRAVLGLAISALFHRRASRKASSWSARRRSGLGRLRTRGMPYK